MPEKNLVARAQQQAVDFMSTALGVPLKIPVEDQMRARIVEAIEWLDRGATGIAREVLLTAKDLH